MRTTQRTVYPSTSSLILGFVVAGLVTHATLPVALAATAAWQDADASATDVSYDPAMLEWHAPDPEFFRANLPTLIEQARQERDKTVVRKIERVAERVDAIRRPEQLRLTLSEAIHRALANSYDIQVQSYNPAIDTARVVEAESVFDAVFFSNMNKSNIDRPSGSQLTSTDLDIFSLNAGVRKLLPTGMQLQGRYEMQRQKTPLSFQLVNPEYTTTFVAEFRQPLLRGFGIDFNRSLIVVAQNDRHISSLAFQRQIRDTLREVEELYWRLVQARRDVVITARLLAEFEGIYDYLVARQTFDVTPVQLAATKASLEQSRADFIRRRATVYDAEDRLIAAMNDPDLDLADNIEIIPMDEPVLERIVVDRLAEVQTALDHRPELKEQQIRIANAKISLSRAMNSELPQFDTTFRITQDGLSGTSDSSFDQATGNNFISYFIGVEFEVPVGNRGPRASRRRAELFLAQNRARLKSTFETVILDVNLAVRELSTTYDQIAPSLETAKAREREVESVIARAERKDLNTLNSELSAHTGLANARRAMLNTMVDYNIAVIDLERAKGTMLRYYNVVVSTVGSDTP